MGPLKPFIFLLVSSSIACNGVKCVD
jgi:hypothetical protein